MASGKTTLGRRVAEMAQLDFVYLDEYVEADSAMSISEIFARHGEAEFRRREAAALRELAGRAGERRLLIACGGGTPCQGDNLDFMTESGTVVWLDVEIDRLVERLIVERSRRPLVASLADDELRRFVERALEGRRPFYSRAPYRFDASRLENAVEVDASARDFISRFIETDHQAVAD